MFSHKQQVNAMYVTLMHKVIQFVHFVMLMQDCNIVTASPDLLLKFQWQQSEYGAKGSVPQSGTWHDASVVWELLLMSHSELSQRMLVQLMPHTSFNWLTVTKFNNTAPLCTQDTSIHLFPTIYSLQRPYTGKHNIVTVNPYWGSPF